MKDKVIELVTIYAGNESDVEAIIRELAVYRSVYIQRMLHYAFVDIGDSEPEVDWSAYNGKPLFTNGEMSQAILDKLLQEARPSYRDICGVSVGLP